MADISSNLKRFRLAKNWSLATLSLRSRVSVSAISKIENGDVSPSFDTLVRICHALEIPFEQLLKDGQGPSVTGRRAVTRRSEPTKFDTSRHTYMVHAVELSSKRMIPMQMTIRAHRVDKQTRMSRHEGEEFVYVLSGEIDFHCEHYTPCRLKAGESVYFDSGMGHAFISVGPEDAEILRVCADAHTTNFAVDRFESGEQADARPGK